MTLTTWNTNNFNANFFNYSYKYKDNAIKTQYLSGRTAGYQSNTQKKKVVSCSVEFEHDTELPAFWSWFNDTLGQTTGAFTCSALGSSYWQFTAIPEPQDTDQSRTVLLLNLEEI